MEKFLKEKKKFNPNPQEYKSYDMNPMLFL